MVWSGGGVAEAALVPRSIVMVASSQVAALAAVPVAQLGGGVSPRCAACRTGWQLGGSLHVDGVGERKQPSLL